MVKQRVFVSEVGTHWGQLWRGNGILWAREDTDQVGAQAGLVRKGGQRAGIGTGRLQGLVKNAMEF